MSQSKGRLLFAAVAAAVLVGAAVVVALSRSSGDDVRADECLTAWNGDQVARGDGVHAYQAHGYRATLVARLGPEGQLMLEADGGPTAQERCAVIFAAPQVDQEPDFGVRVLDGGRWSGLAIAEDTALDEIAELQRDATETANATLLPDGRLADAD